MTLRRYERYKDSGVEWLGEVPAHWDVKRLRFVATINPSKSEIGDRSRESEVSFLPMEAVGDDGSLNLDRTRAIGEVESGYTYFRDGDVTVAKITPCFENGKGALMRGLVGGVGFGTTELIVVRPIAIATTGGYLNWIFRSGVFRQRGEASMYGAGGQKRISEDFVRDFKFPFPPLTEQAALVAYLDRETAKIDTLIAEQQRLIELLAEKRQAVIAHAVNKGLNPLAPMKDAGHEWLGEVPWHWRVVPVKYLADVGNGSTPHRDRADYWTGGDYPWLSSTVVNGEVVLEAEEFVTEFALTECHLPKVTPPAVLIGITGQGKTRGMAALLGIEATINQHIAFVRPRDNSTSAEFLRRYFEMAYQRMRFESDGVGSTKGAITCEQISNMRVPVPPREEQNAIVIHLSRVTSELDRLALEATTAIELLRERRVAVVSAAVTGQIDVRDSASVASALAETHADIAAGRYLVESAAAHVARVQAMAGADKHPSTPPGSC
ncbi:MAG: restriction endonuclease subunit S [Burkholderiales bacterium]|nr:restriction endonuclease subunit S [Burkholderiales bacterium]